MSGLVTIFHSFVLAFILATTSSASEADTSCFLSSPLIHPSVQEFFCNQPFFVWFIGIFTLISMGIAAVAALTGNLQNIIDFCQTNLLRKKAQVSEEKQLKLRKQLLDRLQSDILIRRENSLHNLIQIDLQREEQRHQVGGKTSKLIPQDTENSNPLNRVFWFFKKKNHQTTQPKPTQKIIEFFTRDDIQGKLLILGEPGAGKTTELLSLTQDLIQRAIEDENAPIPIIFELSTWKHERSIRDWLIEQLCDIYKGIPKAVAEHWLDNQQLIPLLDSLDELGLEEENKCIVALNQFLASSFQPGLVVCCRWEEYEQAQSKLEQLNGAIYLQSLSDEQIQQYLKSLNRSSIWNKTIVNAPSLLELCRKPLFLTMLVVAYQGRAIKNDSELFEAYIEQQLNNSDNQGTYPPRKSPSQKQTKRYLFWLARKLEAERETEFLIERMQPTWLESTKQKIVYRIIVGMIFGLILGLGEGFWIISGLSYGLGLFWELSEVLIVGLIRGLIVGLIGGLIVGLIGGLNTGLNIGLIFMLSQGVVGILIYEILFGLIFNRNRFKLIPIKSTEKISWSSRNFFRRVLVGGLIVGLIFGLITGLSFWIIGLNLGLNTALNFGLIFGLLTGLGVGLSVGLSFGLFGGFRSSEIENKNFPNQGIWNSLKNGLIVGLLVFLRLGLNNIGLLVLEVLNTVLIVGLIFGVKSVIQHFVLRLILYLNCYIPWNYAKFLDHAAKHRFIQRVGGRYRFMHDLLRKHFAQMPLR